MVWDIKTKFSPIVNFYENGRGGPIFELHPSNFVRIHISLCCRNVKIFVKIAELVSGLAKISLIVTSIYWEILELDYTFMGIREKKNKYMVQLGYNSYGNPFSHKNRGLPKTLEKMFTVKTYYSSLWDLISSYKSFVNHCNFGADDGTNDSTNDYFISLLISMSCPTMQVTEIQAYTVAVVNIPADVGNLRRGGGAWIPTPKDF